MNIIELKNVCFDYATSEEIEERTEEQERLEKKKKKKEKQPVEVFVGFSEAEKSMGDAPPDEVYAGLTEPAKRDNVLQNVSLSVGEGQFVALVGHNGSGKSTLAKLLNGLLLPVSGDVLVKGLNTKNKKDLFEIRKTVGMVFQNPDNQMIASIVEDDIAFGPENIGVPSGEIRERVDWALAAVGMSDYKEATPFKLSGGQKQRIAIAGMLAIKPRVLVLDESTAMLDPRGRAEVMGVVKALNKDEGITVIHITHFMDEAAMADRIVVLDGGAVTVDGTPREVFAEREALKRAGLNLPSVMEIANLLIERGVRVDANTTEIEELVNEICQLV